MHAEEYHDQLVIGSMLEDALQAQVEALATAFRWRIYHTKDSRGSRRGFPDLVLVRPPRLLFAELKKQKDARASADQKLWLADLEAVAETTASVEVYLWRPAQLIDRTIERTLR